MSRVAIPDNELNSFDLPRVCVVTGATEGIVFKKVKFSWYPRWVPVLVLVNLLIAAIVAMALTKKVAGELPFTEEGYRRWKRAQLVSTLSVLAAVVVVVAGIIVLAVDYPIPGGLMILLGIAGPIVIHHRFVRGRVIQVVEIKNGRIVLNLPSDPAAMAVSRHLSGGDAQAAVEAA